MLKQEEGRGTTKNRSAQADEIRRAKQRANARARAASNRSQQVTTAATTETPTRSARWFDMVNRKLDQADLGLVVGSDAHIVAVEILDLVTSPRFRKEPGSASRFGSAVKAVRRDSMATKGAFARGQQTAYKVFDAARKAVDEELAVEAAQHRGHNMVYSV